MYRKSRWISGSFGSAGAWNRFDSHPEFQRVPGTTGPAGYFQIAPQLLKRLPKRFQAILLAKGGTIWQIVPPS
jgi:hypothetical protein